MSSYTIKNHEEQKQMNLNRSSYAHLLAGGLESKKKKKKEKRKTKNLFDIKFRYHIVLLAHLPLY